MAAPSKQYIRIIDKAGKEHILPDNKHNREFHIRYNMGAPAEDKCKSIELVTGAYTTEKGTGNQEFEIEKVVESLFQHLSPTDSKLEAANSEIDALKRQLEELRKAEAAQQ